MTSPDEDELLVRLPALRPEAAAWLFDALGRLQHELLQRYGDELEAHWVGTEPGQPLCGQLGPPPRAPRKR